jgi:hypothetical protein
MVTLAPNTMSTTPGAQGVVTLHADAAQNGTFAILNVPAGAYTLTAQLPFDIGSPEPITGRFSVPAGDLREQMLNRIPETASIQIGVGSEGLSGITMTTRRGGRLNGRFVADSGVTRPLPTNLSVTLRGSGAGNRALQLSGGSGTDFVLAGSSGPSRIEVAGVPDGWAVKAILIDGENVTDAPFDLSGRTGTLRIVLTDRPTLLTGTVQSNRDRRNFNVVVFSEDAAKWAAGTRFVRAVRADASGSFRLEGLPPERYLAAAVDYLEDGEESDRQLLEGLRTRATSFTLGDGEQRSIQLDVIGR